MNRDRPPTKRNSTRSQKTKRTRRRPHQANQSNRAASGREQLFFIDEPFLEFAGGQLAQDPHDGLALYGPYSSGGPSHPRSPSYVVVGAPEGIEAFRAWAGAMNSGFSVLDPEKPERNAARQRLWPPYPGYEVAFGSGWAGRAIAEFELDRSKLLDASRKADPHERCFAVVEQFIEPFERLHKYDDKPRVAICVVPDEVWSNCRPESRIADPTDAGLSAAEKQARTGGQTDLFSTFNLEQYRYSPDFRRQLKARTMRHDVPVQIIRESTLRLGDEFPFGERRVTTMSDRMWNLGTALYYKSGGKPWKLHSAREGVCYIGIAFRCAGDGPKTACCAAQMFLDSGDGIVFLGEYGPWYSPDENAFHLTKSAARNLLSGILKTYRELDGKPLTEVFLHSRSSIHADEFAGYQQACPPGCKVVGIRVRADSRGPRLFRQGTRPVLPDDPTQVDGPHPSMIYGWDGEAGEAADGRFRGIRGGRAG